TSRRKPGAPVCHPGGCVRTRVLGRRRRDRWGSLVDASGVTLSGTVFLGVRNDPLSARAVTIFGGTGQG
ncbi:MAG: hypothetical protein VX975_00435, partial [Acidobacteriota bacterium]|nr:hypothetical protein [Acidobacteriota bacterium]